MSGIFNTLHIYNHHHPVWDIEKPNFQEQDPDVQAYYVLEYLKLRRGVSWGTVKMHPWTYYHVNYFNILIDRQNSDGVTIDSENGVCELRDNEWMINETLIRAEMERRGIMLFGSRRLAKSVFGASYTTFNAITKQGGETRPCVVNGVSADDLRQVTSYMNHAMKKMHPAFNMYPPTTTDYFNEKGVQFGWKDKTNISYIHSTIKLNNLASGSQSGAGYTPISVLFDECGKYDIKHYFNVLKPAFGTSFGWRTLPIIVGTGGDVKLAQPSRDMFYNPDIHNLVQMDWDLLNRNVPEPTWQSGQKCGIFLPGQCSLEFGKKKTTLAAYLQVEHDYLKKIQIDITDWEKSTQLLKDQLELTKNKDPQTYMDLKTHLPFDVADCFLESGTSPFKVADALQAKIQLETKKLTNFSYEVSYNPHTRSLDVTPSSPDRIQAKYPHPGGNIDCPPQIFIKPPANPSFSNGQFPSGLDAYKQEVSTTDSVGAFYIVKRPTKINDPEAYHIAVSYACRPELMETFYSTIRQLQLGYGSRCLQEAADTGYEQYLKLKFKHLTDTLLVDGRRVAIKGKGKISKSTIKYGLYPTKENKNLVMQAVVTYVNEDVEYRLEDGSSVIKPGVYRIKDLQLLDEIINYRPGKNVDRIVAFGHALLLAGYWDSKFKPATEDNEDQPEKKEKPLTPMQIAEKQRLMMHYAKLKRDAIKQRALLARR